MGAQWRYGDNTGREQVGIALNRAAIFNNWWNPCSVDCPPKRGMVPRGVEAE